MSARVRDFETLLGAGVVDGRQQHANTVGRLIESLALSSGFVAAGKGTKAGGSGTAPLSPFPAVIHAQLTLLDLVHEFVNMQRSGALQPFVKRPLVLPADNLDQINELVLDSLASMIEFTDYSQKSMIAVSGGRKRRGAWGGQLRHA